MKHIAQDNAGIHTTELSADEAAAMVAKGQLMPECKQCGTTHDLVWHHLPEGVTWFQLQMELAKLRGLQ